MLQGEEEAIRYLQAENRVLRDALQEARETKGLLLKDRQQCFLARAAKRLGRKRLRELQPLFTPDILLRWHRELVARKYRSRRRRGRSPFDGTVRNLVIRLAEENET